MFNKWTLTLINKLPIYGLFPKKRPGQPVSVWMVQKAVEVFRAEESMSFFIAGVSTRPLR